MKVYISRKDIYIYIYVEVLKCKIEVFLVSDGKNKPYRCKIKIPDFAYQKANY